MNAHPMTQPELAMDSMQLSEMYMKDGLWEAAREVLYNPDVEVCDRNLQGYTIDARRECVKYINDNLEHTISFQELLNEFDRFTVFWALTEYRGKDAEAWQIKSEKVNGLMD